MTTKIQDLIKHDEFALYVLQAMADRSVLLRSGIAATDAVIAGRCNAAGAGGEVVNLPFFNELGLGGSYEAAPIVEDTPLTPDKITADVDRAVICRRGKPFGATDLSAMESGADPLKAIGDGIADWWNKAQNVRLVNTLNGALGAVSDLVLDVATTGGSGTYDKCVTADSLLDAAQLLGDQKSALTAYAMSSATETWLQKLEGADLFKPSELPGNLKVYNGRAVVVDDNIADGTVYLFAPGAVALNDCPCEYPIEAYRDELGSHSGIVTRNASILHVRGIKWIGDTLETPVHKPTNSNLATVANWAKVYPTKHIRVAMLKGTIVAAS